MSDEDAYNIVKTLFEKKADIVAVHKEAESFSLDNQVRTLADPVPSRRAEILQGKGYRRLGFDIRGPDGADALSGRRLQ